MTERCCGKPKIEAVYLSSYTQSQEPILVCAKFVAAHPAEFRVVTK